MGDGEFFALMAACEGGESPREAREVWEALRGEPRHWTAVPVETGARLLAALDPASSLAALESWRQADPARVPGIIEAVLREPRCAGRLLHLGRMALLRRMLAPDRRWVLLNEEEDR